MTHFDPYDPDLSCQPVALLVLAAEAKKDTDAAIEEDIFTPTNSRRQSDVPAPKRTPLKPRGRDQRHGRSKEEIRQQDLQRRKEKRDARRSQQRAAKEKMAELEPEETAKELLARVEAMLLPQEDIIKENLRMVKFDFLLGESDLERPGALRGWLITELQKPDTRGHRRV